MRTVFYSLFTMLALIFAGAGTAAHAQDSLYTVENVEVDTTAENAVQAREKALEEAQVKAYRMLAEKFLGAEAMEGFQDPDPLLVATMVQDFEVTNEQLSAVRYKGVFTVRFRPAMMRRYFPESGYAGGAPGMTGQPAADPVLVLPYYQHEQRTVLWDQSNEWLKAWSASEKKASQEQPAPAPSTEEGAEDKEKKAAAPAKETVIVPIGDILDVTQMPDDKALTYDPQMLKQIKGRYGAQDAAILIAVPKKAVNSADILEISLYEALPSGPRYIRTIAMASKVGESLKAFYQRAAGDVKTALSGTWKTAPNESAAQDNAGSEAVSQGGSGYPPSAEDIVRMPQRQAPRSYTGRVHFSSVQEWVRVKALMENLPGMKQFTVNGLSPREAQVSLAYQGDAEQMRRALQQAGISMNEAGGGYGYGGNSAYDFSAGAARY